MSARRVDDILLVAYLDGELAPEAVEQLERLVAQDEATARRLGQLRHSAALLREALAEEHFVKRNEKPRPARRLGVPWRGAAMGLAGLAAGLAIGVIVLQPASAPDPAMTVLEEVAEYHAVFTRESEHLVEVPASRREHIETWLGDRVGLPLAVPDLTANELRFEGARMLVVEGSPVAQLIYTGRNGERIALCASRLAKQDRKTPIEFRGEGLHLVGVTRDDHLFIVAGDAGSPLVASLAEKMPGLLLRRPG
jgi:anti-sigma factor RsiW